MNHTATHCHCGRDREGQDHCPHCGCEEFERYCDAEYSDESLTRARLQALTSRRDLLAKEAAMVDRYKMTWRTREAQLGDYGKTGGGSASDRRLVVEAMAALERQARE